MQRRRDSRPGPGCTARAASRPRCAALASACAGILLLMALSSAPMAGGRRRPDGTPGPSAATSPPARARFLMGTRLSIEIDGPVPSRAFEDAFDEVARLEEILSNWRATSELSRLNARAARSEVHCSPDLYRAISVSLEWAEKTGGAFDPTVEPLVRALGLRPDEERPVHGEDPVAATGPTGRLPIGRRHVRLIPSLRSVRFDADGVGIDLGGIGKGIALDAAARILAREGVRSALLDFGGQLLAIGRPPGADGWPVGIADPGDRDAPVAAFRVADASLATSGNGERAVTGPDGPIGHILDPGSQRPATFGGTTTVVSVEATSADALSTALFVMGPERGLSWAEGRDIPVLYLWRGPDGVLRHGETRAFGARFAGWSAALGR
ncbi:MAG: hypothetical protein AUH92_03170 [Acidobacteria bacterium 13_1_40CM_4_69_4]|nr:MAG: hypothetical protein AUH92_03170 [Acidobacteria bacterium 13_1_40CM_4_69_4]